MAPEPPASRGDFRVAIVCALPLEFDAVVDLLDHVWDKTTGPTFSKESGDFNTYLNGRLGPHNVVLVLLPLRMGKTSAAIAATDLRRTYTNLDLVLLVGICGGVPKVGSTEILLGDVVVSNSVIQYDFGRQYPDGFRRKDGAQDNLNGPTKAIRSLLALFSTEYGKTSLHQNTSSFLKALRERGEAKRIKYAFPGAANDRLFRPDYRHKHQVSPTCACQLHEKEEDPVCDDAIEATCETLRCDHAFLVERARIEKRLQAASEAEKGSDACDPMVHIGPVASGDTVMKSGLSRDRIAAKEGVIAFEMEAAGLWEHLPSLVVKAVCDYADSHKNKLWQNYAAGSAAATAKAILMLHTPAESTATHTTAPLEPLWALPFPPDPEFVNQPEALTWLEEKSQLPGARVALVGLGGIGKSQLAIHFAQRVRKTSHVFWVNGTTLSTMQESYRAIAAALGLEEQGGEGSLDTLLRAVAGWLGREQNGRWTVVLDNFDDSSILTADDPRLLKMLPQTSTGFTVITSRTLKAAERLTGSAKNVFAVPAMSPEAALALFQAKLTSECPREAGLELVGLLEHMPLAISQAAAFINRRNPPVSVAEYAAMFRAGDADRRELLDWEYNDLRRYDGVSNSVLGAWTVTLEQIQRERPSAADLLSLMSFFNPQQIPEWALQSWDSFDTQDLPPLTVRDISRKKPLAFFESRSLGERYFVRTMTKLQAAWYWKIWADSDLAETRDVRWKWKKDAAPTFKSFLNKTAGKKVKLERPKVRQADSEKEGGGAVQGASGLQEQFQQDLDTLLGYSFVTLTATKGVLKMHPLVRYCTRAWLARTGRFVRWKKRFLLVMTVHHNYNRVNWWRGHESTARRADLSTHVEPLVDEEPEEGSAHMARLWIHLVMQVAERWRETNRAEQAAKLRYRILALCDRELGEGEYMAIMTLSELADQLYYQKKYDEAETVTRTLLQRQERLASEWWSYQARGRYALVLSRLGRHDEAGQTIRRTADEITRDAEFGEQHPDTLWIMATQAAILAAMGRPREACDVVLRVLRSDWMATYPDKAPDIVDYNWIMRPLDEATKAMVDHAPAAAAAAAAEVEPLLRKVVEFVEGNPSSCQGCVWWAHGVFHSRLAWCLQLQGKLDEEKQMLDRGLRLMASAVPLPTSLPPGLVDSLLESPVNSEEASELLRELSKQVSAQTGKQNDSTFYGRVANIGRRLFVQGRPAEGFVLLQTLCDQLTATYGKSYTLTESILTLWKCLGEWELGQRPPPEDTGV